METPVPTNPLSRFENPIWRRRAFLTGSTIFFGGVLIAFRAVLTPFVLAVLVAYVLAPVVTYLEQRRFRGRQPRRWLVVLSIYITLLLVIFGTIFFGAPVFARETRKLVHELPTMARTVETVWLPRVQSMIPNALTPAAVVATPDEPRDANEDPVRAVNRSTIHIAPDSNGGYWVELPDQGLEIRPSEHGYQITSTRDETPPADLGAQLRSWVTTQMHSGGTWMASLLQTGQSIVFGLVGGVFRFFIMLMLSAYLLITQESIFDFFETFVRPTKRKRYRNLLIRMDRGLSGVVRGQLLISLVNGALSGVGFYALGLPYWPLLTVLATLFSVVPIFGAFISTIPAGIVALQISPGHFIGVVVWIVIIHQIEANLLNPKIMGDAAKVHPVLVVFALIAGEHFFGIMGALLAVPLLSLAQTLFLHFRELALGIPASLSMPPPQPESPGGVL